MKYRRSQRGVAVVELALVIPMLMLLMLIVTELGRAVMQYNTLAKSVRDGARYLTMQLPGTKLTEARNLVVYGNTAGTGSPLVPGLTTTHVPDPTWQMAGALPEINTVTVRVSGFSFSPMMASAFGVSFGPFTFADIVVTMRSQV
jgi:hypothetical protein